MGDDRTRSMSVVSRVRGFTTASRAPPSSACGSATPSSHASERTELDGTSRRVRFSDQQLLAMAADAASAITWDALKKPPSASWRRKKLGTNTSSTLSVYTRDDPQSFAVLASALLQCSVQELRLVFDTRTSEQLRDVLQTLSPCDVLAAELVHSVHRRPGSRSTASRVASAVSTASASSSSVASTASRRRHASADVVVTSMTFDRPNVFARHEEWCFLESLHDATRSTASVDSSSSSTRAFTKTLLALHPVDCAFERVAPRAKHGRDVLAGFRFEEETDGRSTRVLFSAELFYSTSSSKAQASHRTVRTRLLQMAQWIDRIALIVRRRRLGIQVLADRRSVLHAPNSHCVCCRRSFKLARKRSCALCGLFVCERCSAPEARETCPDVLARSVVTLVRVCDTCMVRVNQCRYAMVTAEALAPARVVADAPTPVSRTTGAVLSHLLHETMANASDARKRASRSVIKYLVEQETTPQCVSLTDASTDAQYFAALYAHLNSAALPLDECELGNVDKRSYALSFPDDPSRPAAAPIGPTEPLRLKLLDEEQYLPVLTRPTRSPTSSLVPETPSPSPQTSTLEATATPPTPSPELLLSLDKVPELDIICAIASKELACSGSLITLVGKDAMHVVASTIDALASKSFPRDQGFCSQTIMSDKPLLVPHPESDVRFANITPVAQLGVRFYCGFPLMAADATTVIGSVCCVDHESRELTQSQYTVMQKLATTASRVVQVQAKARRLQNTVEQRLGVRE